MNETGADATAFIHKCVSDTNYAHQIIGAFKQLRWTYLDDAIFHTFNGHSHQTILLVNKQCMGTPRLLFELLHLLCECPHLLISMEMENDFNLSSMLCSAPFTVPISFSRTLLSFITNNECSRQQSSCLSCHQRLS